MVAPVVSGAAKPLHVRALEGLVVPFGTAAVVDSPTSEKSPSRLKSMNPYNVAATPVVLTTGRLAAGIV
jgi:hypothetical protein